jgi:hypothetical protein
MFNFDKKHNKELLKRTVNYLKTNCTFLENLGLFQGEKFVVSSFYLYPHYTNNLAHKRVAENATAGIFKSAYVNTKKNCIHVLCKNDLEFLTPAGC